MKNREGMNTMKIKELPPTYSITWSHGHDGRGATIARYVGPDQDKAVSVFNAGRQRPTMIGMPIARDRQVEVSIPDRKACTAFCKLVGIPVIDEEWR